MRNFAGSLSSGPAGEPAAGLWLLGGVAVVAMHAALALALNGLTPGVPPVLRNPALTVELAPFTVPAVEQDHQLLSASEAAGDVLSPVRQSQPTPSTTPDRIRPAEAPRTVAEAIAAAAPAVLASPDATPAPPARPGRAAPTDRPQTAVAGSAPDRVRPVDAPRDVAEAIAAAETDPLTAIEQASPIASSRPVAPGMAVESTGSIALAQPVAPPTAELLAPDMILSGAIVPDPFPAEADATSAAPSAPAAALDPADPAMPDIVGFAPTTAPRRALAAARVAASKAVAAKAAREARQRAAARAAALAHAPATPRQPAISAGPPPAAMTPAERQVAAARGTAAVDPATWQRRVSAILNGRKICPAGGRIAGDKVVQIRFPVDASGRIGAARVARSSGNPALDRAALDAARRVSPLPPPPRGRAVSVGVSLRFSGC